MAARKSKDAEATKATEAVPDASEAKAEEKAEEVAVMPENETHLEAEAEIEPAAEVEAVEVETEEAETPVEILQPRDVGYWRPRTALGKEVASGAAKSIDDVLKAGRKMLEPQIVDFLVPELKSELIQIGGRKGKGGGKERIPVKITATMHRSGRRFTYNAFAIVGDEAGLVGVGRGSAIETRSAINKAIGRAKMNIIRIKRGCGSWECGCGGDHSIPYKTTGKTGSVSVVLMPAPKGLGLAADDESKKILKMAGIKDVWMKTYGNTGMRINLVNAVFDALKNLYAYER
ncbi:MAG: 30S ribosomal protein S5 [Candidatus Aenigmatarchaeota archaeon]